MRLYLLTAQNRFYRCGNRLCHDRAWGSPTDQKDACGTQLYIIPHLD